MLHLSLTLIMPHYLVARLGARRKLLIILQPRDNPLPILLLTGMNHHLRRPLFLRHCLVFSEANVSLSGSLASSTPRHHRYDAFKWCTS